MVHLNNLRNDEHYTEEDMFGVPGHDEYPSLSPDEEMEVLELMGQHPLGSCELHTKRYGLFGRGVEACKDYKPASKDIAQDTRISKLVCGFCRYWHFEGIGE